MLGPLSALVLGAPRRSRALAGFAAGVALGIALGCLLFLPIADPLGWLGSTRDKLGAVRLGYLARVFPVPWGASRLWLGDPFGVGTDVSRYVLPANALLTVAAGAGGVAVFRLLRRRPSPRDLLLLAVCLSAALLLPKLVSRPGLHQFPKVLPGVLVAATALLERAVLFARAGPVAARALPVGS